MANQNYYKANLRDLTFLLFEQFKLDALLGKAPYANWGKDEVVGLIAALELYVKRDHAAEMRQWNARAQRIVDRLQGIRGLEAKVAPNTAGYADADLSWDERQVALNRDTLHAALAKGSPRVELEVIVTQDRGTTVWHATARTRVLRDGEELMVARRLREVFEGARVAG